jgi:hypothetical protein
MFTTTLPERIKKIAIVDDNPEARESIGECISDADMEPVFESPGGDSVEQYISRIMKNSDAAIFDHHLKLGNYAGFDGAEAVAYAYSRHFPALLMTIYADTDIKEIRPIRRRIPVLIPGLESDIDIIRKGIKQCIDEFSNQYLPERKPHRTIIRITEVYEDSLNVIVPAWDHRISIAIPRSLIPDELGGNITLGARFIAYVNIGASRFEQIYFEKFELAKEPEGEYAKLLRT